MEREELVNICCLMADDQPAGLSYCESLLSCDFDSLSSFFSFHR
jgi:hypothetical protein